MTAPAPDEWRRGEYAISTDPARLDVGVIHGYLERSYWATGVPRDVVARSIEHSLNFGLYHDGAQIGFARVVTDYARYAYLADVFVLEGHRERGLGVWLVETVLAHPQLQGIQRWMLGTRDAHTLYEKAGFRRLASPERWMEIAEPDFYLRRPSMNDRSQQPAADPEEVQ